jgi:hypothetical protein
MDSLGSGWGSVAESCEHGSKPSGSIKVIKGEDSASNS